MNSLLRVRLHSSQIYIVLQVLWGQCMAEQYGAVPLGVQFQSNHAVTLQQAEAEAGLQSDPLRSSECAARVLAAVQQSILTTWGRNL